MIDYTNSRVSQLIEENIHNKKYRGILVDRLVDGLTFEQLAEKHSLSVRQCKNIVYKYGRKILEKL